MRTSRIITLFTVLIIVTVALTYNSCKKKGSEDPPPDPIEFQISPEAKFITDNDWQSMLESIDSTTYTLTFHKDLLNTYSFTQGNLIVSSVGNGLLRKVESIDLSGNDVQIQTSQATLEDLIQQGDIDYSGSLNVSQIKSITYHYPGITLDTINTKSTDDTFYWDIDTEISPQIQLQGNFQYTSDFIFQIQMRLLQGLKKVKFGFEGDEEFNLALIAGQQFTLNKQVTLVTVYFTPIFITLPVPPFVIVVVPVLEIKLGVEGYANANITTTLSQAFTIETGLQYLKDEGWSSYMNDTKTFDYTPPQLNVNASAEAFLKPELSMLIYNLLGPYINAKGYGRIEADLTQNPWWKMYYGFNVSGGAKATILGRELFDFSVGDLLSWEQEVGQSSSGTPPTITTNTVTNITETSATCGGNVTDQGSSSVTAKGVCWSTSSNPTTSDSHTTDGNGTGSFTSNITGLTANTPYYVRAYATNSAGTAYGNQQSFTTQGGGGGSCEGVSSINYQGQMYNTVEIEDQCWLKENLNIGIIVNGSQEQTNNGQIEKYCYNNSTSNCEKYGGLYQWDEMMQYVTSQGAQGICPDGWHIPTDGEWKILEGSVDSQYGIGNSVWNQTGFRGYDAGKNLKDEIDWSDGANLFDFSSFHTGNRHYSLKNFHNLDDSGLYWCSDDMGSSEAYYRLMHNGNDGVNRTTTDKGMGFAVRCIKDN